LRLDDLKPHLPYIDDSRSNADTPPPPTPPTNPSAENNVYYDARCHGRNLMKAMTLDEAESSALLRWPYTHSLWDGGLRQEFATWSYHDTPADDDEFESTCDFETHHEMSRTFKDLGISAKPSNLGGDNHCFEVNHSNGPTMGKLANGKLPAPHDQWHIVNGKKYWVRR
jgi:hypothetical protein